MDSSLSLVVVLPTYNERENIRNIVRDVLALPCAPQMLIVDDNSPDGTGDIADELCEQYPGRVHVLHRTAKEGLGRAYVAGFTRALELGTTHIAQMDADFSHAPDDLQKMVDVAESSDADLVLGSRYMPGGSTAGWPWHRRAISRFGSLYAGLVVGVPVRDLTGGFKVWKRETLEAIDLQTIQADGYLFQVETTNRALRLGKTWQQVPITFHDRVAGKSKISRNVVIEAAIKVWVMRLRRLQGGRW